MATPITTASTAVTGTSQRGAAIGAMLLGSVLLFVIGFAPMPAVHNAAHDTRHSTGFPCH
jgi:cobalt transporter subunit CbtB